MISEFEIGGLYQTCLSENGDDDYTFYLTPFQGVRLFINIVDKQKKEYIIFLKNNDTITVVNIDYASDSNTNCVRVKFIYNGKLYDSNLEFPNILKYFNKLDCLMKELP
jgi:hypothetical protein